MMELPKRHAIPLKVSRFAPMQKILTGFLSAAPPPLTTGRNFEAGQRTLHGSHMDPFKLSSLPVAAPRPARPLSDESSVAPRSPGESVARTQWHAY
jgi:hypothetical protein